MISFYLFIYFFFQHTFGTLDESLLLELVKEAHALEAERERKQLDEQREHLPMDNFTEVSE